MRGEDETARALYEESLALYQELDHRFSAATVLHNLGYVAQHQGELRRGLTCFAAALAEHSKHGNRPNIGHCLGGVAGIIAPLGQPEQAARLFGAAAALFATIGAPIWPVDRIDYDRNLAAVRNRLGQEAFSAAYAAGQALPLAQALTEAAAAVKRAEAAAEIAAAPIEPSPTAAGFGLTAREAEVLHLMARRATDREIADHLSISPRTVMHHVSRVLAKLGVSNRRDAAALAVRAGIS